MGPVGATRRPDVPLVQHSGMTDKQMSPHMAEARRILSRGLVEARSLTPRAQAEAAHYAGGPSIDELERMVLARREHNPSTSS